jgi:hypothetical protein
MLNVDRAQHVNLVLEKVQHILVPLAKSAAFNVRMSKFIDQCDLRHARQNGVDIHLGKDRPFVVDLAPGHLLQFRCELSGPTAAMRLYDSDDDIFAAAAASNALTQHAECLTNTWSIAKEHLEPAALFLGFTASQPFFW